MIKHQKQMVVVINAPIIRRARSIVVHRRACGLCGDDFMEMKLEFYLQGLGGFGLSKEMKSTLGGKRF